jgi:hypothetical protein
MVVIFTQTSKMVLGAGTSTGRCAASTPEKEVVSVPAEEAVAQFTTVALTTALIKITSKKPPLEWTAKAKTHN